MSEETLKSKAQKLVALRKKQAERFEAIKMAQTPYERAALKEQCRAGLREIEVIAKEYERELDALKNGDPTPLAAAQAEIERLKAERAAALCDVDRAIKQSAAPKNPFDAESEWFAHQVWGKVRAGQQEIEDISKGRLRELNRVSEQHRAEWLRAEKAEGELASAQAEIERLRELVETAHTEGYSDGFRDVDDTVNDNGWNPAKAWQESAVRAILSTPPAPQSSAKTELEIIRAFFVEVDERAAKNILKTGVVSGAHYNAMKTIIAEREAAAEEKLPAERDFMRKAKEIIERAKTRGCKALYRPSLRQPELAGCKCYFDDELPEDMRGLGQVAGYVYTPLDDTPAVFAVAESLRSDHTYDT